MGINKRSPRGSTLMFVIVVFTFIMLLTVGLMTVTIASHKNAIYQKEKRQAYFSAKSIVDTCVSYITDDTKSYSEQKELIGIGGNLIDKTSDEVEIRDAQGGIWRSHVDVSATVEGGVPKVKVVGTAKNSNNGVEGTVTAIIREDVSTETSNLVVHSNIDLNIRDQLEIVDILSKGGEVRAIVNSDLSAKTIQSHGVINIQSVNGKLITGDIISGVNNGILEETGAPIALKAKNGISTGSIYGPTVKIESTGVGKPVNIAGDILSVSGIEIIAEGPVTIEGVLSAYLGEVKIKTSYPVTFDATKAQDSNNNIEIIGGSNTSRGVSGTETHRITAKNALRIKPYSIIPESDFLLKNINITEDANIYRYFKGSSPDMAEECPQGASPDATDASAALHKNCLVLEYGESSVVKRIHIVPSSTLGYKIKTAPTSRVYFGMTRGGAGANIGEVSYTDSRVIGIDGRDSSGKVLRYNIFTPTDKSTDPDKNSRPTIIKFMNNTNIHYCGNFYPSNGINIEGNASGLSFGSTSYVFEKYRE